MVGKEIPGSILAKLLPFLVEHERFNFRLYLPRTLGKNKVKLVPFCF
jgi:hypothetical protein